MTSKLFEPLALGAYGLPNRIVMAPMTRSRANAAGVPSPLAVEYYTQRASAGLIVTEATQTSPMGQGYARTPGMHDLVQGAAWRAIASSVHAQGGRIFLQLFHVGRIAHRANRTVAAPPVAPSEGRANGKIWTDTDAMQPFDAPVAVAASEVQGVVQEFARSTELAMESGFDGVELHAASGYLHMQFLTPGVNRRTDRYGGSAANRARFVVETLEAMIGAAGSAAKVGIKISPAMPFNDCTDPDPLETYSELVKTISSMGLAYLHTMQSPGFDVAPLRALYRGPFLLGGGFYTRAAAESALDSGAADAIVFGKLFVSNPDLPARFKKAGALAEAHQGTFYTPGAKGYTDYPAMS
jgi:N-ethylmaleimide reductase